MPTFCSYHDRGLCRSCTWIETAYPAQLRKKEAELRARLSFLEPFELRATTSSSEQGFRNRAKMAVTGTLENPVIGLHGENELDRGRELLTCPIHHPRLNEIFQALPEFIRKYRLIPYQIQSRTGELKGLIAYHAAGSGESYLRFVLRSKECVARLQKMLPELREKFPSLVCVSANIQPIPHAILEGPEEILITEQSSIDHRIGDVRLRLAPRAFVQTNSEVATRLYQTASSWISEVRPARAMELYCGQGAFGFVAAAHVSSWLGIEINEEAVRTANETARVLGHAHLSFKCLDATQVGDELARFAPDLVLANPPRKGIGAGAELVMKSLPRDFIYSSCAIDSLAQDLEKLKDKYELLRVQIFDLFPHTEHFETLAWLRLRAAPK